MRLARILVAAALCAPATALGDELHFTGGRAPLTNVEILTETYESVVYKVSGSNQTEPTQNVAKIVHTNRTMQYRRAEEKLQKGDPRGAAADFAAVASDPRARPEHQWQKHYGLFYGAEANRQAGEFGKAIEGYGAVLEDNPKSFFYAPAKLGIGQAKLAMGDRAGARAAFSELESEAKSKKLGDHWGNSAALALAGVLEDEGKLKEALDLYARVANLGQGSAAVKAGIKADSLRAQLDPGRADQAASAIQQKIDAEAKKKDGAAPDLEVVAAGYNALGDVFSKKEDHKKALLAYLHVALDEEMKKLASERPKALYGAAIAFEKAKTEDWKARSEMLKRELKEAYPGSPWARKVN